MESPVSLLWSLPEGLNYLLMIEFPVKKSPGKHPLSGKPDFQATVQKMIQQKLNRSLSQFEHDMLVYPRLCSVCLDGLQSKMITCKNCHCVAYCSKEHLSQDFEFHSRSCQQLRIVIEDQRLECSILKELQQKAVFNPILIRDAYSPRLPNPLILSR